MERAISDEHTLEFLLAFDGRIHHLEQGYWLKFEIKRGRARPERPHGLRYSFTLHGPAGDRLIGFDNAHGVAPLGSRFRPACIEHDHWHRTGDDPGRPYDFTTADQLLADFFSRCGGYWRRGGSMNPLSARVTRLTGANHENTNPECAGSRNAGGGALRDYGAG